MSHNYYIFTKGKSDTQYHPSGVWMHLDYACYSFLHQLRVGVWATTEHVTELYWQKWETNKDSWQVRKLEEGTLNLREMRLQARSHSREVADKRRERQLLVRKKNAKLKQEKAERKQLIAKLRSEI